MVRLQISCKLEDIVENLDADDEDHQLLKENLKLEEMING